VDSAPAASALQVDELGDGLYVLRGGGRTVQIGGVTLTSAGNTIVFVTGRGVIVVDTKLPGWGRPILDAVAALTPRPVTTVINTHTHMDHVGGNVELEPGTEVIAHESTARLMAEMRPVSGGPVQPNPFRAHGGRGLPTRTFRDRLALGEGAERVELHYFGPAHTSGDAWVVFPAQGVLHAGDAFAHKAVPPLDVNNGASGLEYPLTIARAAAALRGVRTVVSGHYPGTLALADLARYGEFMGAFVRTVESGRAQGRSIDDVAGGWTIPEAFVQQGYVSVAHLRPIRADVEAVWNELEARDRGGRPPTA
jgi:glyoxylase-like metal-dependent hydrolase (beta-lactamase superfamily II)